MNSAIKFWGIDVFFSTNELENNDPSGNKESAMYCQQETFNRICYSTNDLKLNCFINEFSLWRKLFDFLRFLKLSLIKVGLSPSKKICVFCFSSRNDEKCFLFHLKSSFRSQDI